MATGYVNDTFGNVVAAVSGSTLTWNTTQVGGYGPVPRTQTVSLSGTTTLGQATVWRGRRLDETGLYYLGARYYDPQNGRFLSPDPLGHAASMDLYSYASGDPTRFADPTGRVASQIAQHWHDDYQKFQGGVEDAIGNTINSLLHPIDTAWNLGSGLGDLSVQLQVDPWGTATSAWNNFADTWSDPNKISAAIGNLTGNVELGLGGTAFGELFGGEAALGETSAGQTAGTDAFANYMRQAQTVDVSTVENGAVFYSGDGNRVLAEQFATANGKTTLEMTPGGQWFDQQQLYNAAASPLTQSQADQVWATLSQRFAEQASGTSVGFVEGARPTGMFTTIEYPALLQNPNVVNVITGGH